MIYLISFIMMVVFFVIIFVEVMISKVLFFRFFKQKVHIWMAGTLVAVVVSAFPWAGIFMQQYQKQALELTCDGNIGYIPFSPTRITSIINEDDPLKFLKVQNVEFTEWEKTTEPGDKFTDGRYTTQYRFRYYDEGAEQCKNLPLLINNVEEEVARLDAHYEEYGYSTKNVEGQCIGVEIVVGLEAVYEFQDQAANNFMTDYGVPANWNSIRLFDRMNDREVSHFREYDMTLHYEWWMGLFGITSQKQACSTYYALLQENNLDVERMEKPHFIERGFFAFENDEEN